MLSHFVDRSGLYRVSGRCNRSEIKTSSRRRASAYRTIESRQDFIEQSQHELKEFTTGLFCTYAVAELLQTRHRQLEAGICGCQVCSAVVGQGHKRMNLVIGAEANILIKASDLPAEMITGVLVIGLVGEHISRRCDETMGLAQVDNYRYGCQFRARNVICRSATMLCGCEVKRDYYCGARTDRRRNIQEIFLRVYFDGNDGPHAVQREESDAEQQPNKGKLSDFPRAFHDFPDFNFAAIVARSEECA
ncbi:hypothetical protein [Burkholderia cepacia]|uniref:hypothetical protein n=1 Tax=Burkholderia cepacia TaxID=292 RepID=UPI002FE3E373